MLKVTGTPLLLFLTLVVGTSTAMAEPIGIMKNTPWRLIVKRSWRS